MFEVRLTWKSLCNRKVSAFLSMLSVCLSVALIQGIDVIRQGAKTSFTGTISQTDLIVGAKGGTLNLLLYTVFQMGTPTENMSYDAFESLSRHPAIEWIIPFSLGDSHRGFRVVGTTTSFYKHFRHHGDHILQFREGQAPEELFDVALGSDVAKALGYRLGDPVVVSHGVGGGHLSSFLHHDDKPFHVVGILETTGTPIDRSLYITLEGMEAIHVDWKDGAPPQKGDAISPSQLQKDKIVIDQVTSLLLRTKSRRDVLSLQREINLSDAEPLMAVIPGVALSELWRGLSYIEGALKAVAYCVFVVASAGVLISLLSTLQDRRRELAILRALGASGPRLARLLVWESTILLFGGSFLGWALSYGLILAVKPYLASSMGLYLTLDGPTLESLFFLLGLGVVGLIVGILPALLAYRTALHDGLTIKV